MSEDEKIALAKLALAKLAEDAIAKVYDC